MVSTSSLSHLAVLNMLLQNRSSADSEVIEGGKDKEGERNHWSDSYGVMAAFSRMPRPLLKKSRRDLVTQLTICRIPAITQPYANVICVVKIEGVRSCMVCVIGSFSKY